LTVAPTLSPPPTPTRRRRIAPWLAARAALTVLALGAVAAVVLVVGNHPWEGPMVRTIVGTHGVHKGDVLAVVPVLASAALARWCWRRRT
jgi:hypothetical protein